jgi:hypothetical protein
MGANMKKIIMGCWLLLASSAASADVYKCTMPGGKIEYQSMPCAVGTEKAIDDRDARRERQREKDRENEAKAARAMVGGTSDQCWNHGRALASVYMANVLQMARDGLMASVVMRDGCAAKVVPDCVVQCEHGFKQMAKELLK